MRDRFVKSFSISCAALRPLAVVLLALLAALPAQAARGKELSIEDLTNFLLGPDYSQWLVGAISEMATEAERREYLSLTSDDEAAAFIEVFWRKRDDPARPWPQEQTEGVFKRRAEEADRLFTEGTTRGRRTDRGKIHILFGPADQVDFFSVAPPRRGMVEMWRYSRDAAPGLTGDKPRGEYFFREEDGLTVLYSPSVKDRRRRLVGNRP